MRADARRNYEKLLVEARAAFEAHGVHASLEDIAKSAGVGIGTLYRHFPTRDALLVGVMWDRFEQARMLAYELQDRPDPLGALADWLAEFVAGSSVYRGMPESVTGVLNDPDSELYAACHGMREAAAVLLRRAQQAGLVREDISAIDVFLMANAVSWAAERVSDDPDRTGRLLGVLIDGLSVTGR